MTLHPGGWKRSRSDGAVELTYINCWGSIPVVNGEVVSSVQWVKKRKDYSVAVLKALMRCLAWHYEPTWRIIRDMCWDQLSDEACDNFRHLCVTWASLTGPTNWYPKTHSVPIWEKRYLSLPNQAVLRLPFLDTTLRGLNNLKAVKVIVPEGVTKLAPFAFHFAWMEELVLPSSLLEIAKNALCHTLGRCQVIFKSNKVSIEEAAFLGNSSGTSLVFLAGSNPSMARIAARIERQRKKYNRSEVCAPKGTNPNYYNGLYRKPKK